MASAILIIGLLLVIAFIVQISADRPDGYHLIKNDPPSTEKPKEDVLRENQSASVLSSQKRSGDLDTISDVGIYAMVVRVVDGDTIQIDILPSDYMVKAGTTASAHMLTKQRYTMRLIGINTPETVDPRKPVECFGREASAEAKRLLTGRQVRIELDLSQNTYDRYGRLLGYVFVRDVERGALEDMHFNLYMIKNGFAYEYTYDDPYAYQEEFKQAEQEARENSRGLWGPEGCHVD